MLKCKTIIGIIIVLLNMSACRKQDLTKTKKMNLPWIASEIRAVERQVNYFKYFSDSISTTKLYWGTEKKIGRNVEDYVNSIEKFLKKNKYIDKWERSNSYVDGQVQKFAPFSFYIVSIEPLVIILVPKSGMLVYPKSSVIDLVGWPCDNCITVKWMVNYIEYGSIIPFNKTIFWFSPENMNKLSKGIAVDNRIILYVKSTRLDLVKVNNTYKVTRREAQ